MPAAYSQDSGQRAPELILEDNMTFSEVARLFAVSRKTLHNWKNRFEQTGTTAPAASTPSPKPSAVTANLQQFEAFVDEHRDKPQQDKTKRWPNSGVVRSADTRLNEG